MILPKDFNANKQEFVKDTSNVTSNTNSNDPKNDNKKKRFLWSLIIEKKS